MAEAVAAGTAASSEPAHTLRRTTLLAAHLAAHLAACSRLPAQGASTGGQHAPLASASQLQQQHLTGDLAPRRKRRREGPHLASNRLWHQLHQFESGYPSRILWTRRRGGERGRRQSNVWRCYASGQHRRVRNCWRMHLCLMSRNSSHQGDRYLLLAPPASSNLAAWRGTSPSLAEPGRSQRICRWSPQKPSCPSPRQDSTGSCAASRC